MSKRFHKCALFTASLFLLFLYAGCSAGYTFSEKENLISETQSFKKLIIEDGQVLTAPEGSLLTMTVKGIDTPVTAGTYKDVVLAVTEGKTVKFWDNEHVLRMGLCIEDGQVVSEKSVESALEGVTYDGKSASGGKITSTTDLFNGIVVGGNSKYEIKDMELDFTGNGGNDFAGYGAALMSTDDANLTISNVTIKTHGAIRTGIFAGGHSTLHVTDSTIIGTSADSTEGVTAPMLTEVPWVLGLYGNNRSTNVLASAHVTYERCTVKADKWGALSTDSCDPGATLTAIDCTVEITGESGYATYADRGIFNTYTNTTLTAPDFGLIVAAGQCGALFNGKSVINSDRFGIMWHKNQEGTVTLEKDTVVNAGNAVFLVKSDVPNTAYPNIVVDGATLNSKEGIILHLMESDDAGMAGGPPGSDTMWAKEYVIPEVKPVVDGNKISDPANKTNVDATFKNTALNGDIYNTRWTAGQNLNVILDDTNVTGKITAGVQAAKDLKPGEKITRDTREKLSDVVVTPHEIYSNGLLVTLNGTSSWQVAGTSYISYLKIADGATVTAPEGKSLKMLVDGKETEIKAGTYTGKITIEIQ